MENPLKRRKIHSNLFQPGIVMQSHFDVCLLILDYLDNKELIKERLYFLERNYRKNYETEDCHHIAEISKIVSERSNSSTKISASIYECSRSNYTQIIPEFTEEWLCCSCRKLQKLNMSIEYNGDIEGVKYEFLKPAMERLPPSKIVILRSGFQMNRFFISHEDLQQKLQNGNWNLAEIIKAPKEDIKCILMFIDGYIHCSQFKNIKPLCAIAGIGTTGRDPSTVKIITFSGKSQCYINFSVRSNIVST